MYVCMHGYHFWQSKDRPDEVANLLVWSANKQGKLIFPCPRSHVRIWSRETGSAVPSRAILVVILHTQAKSGAFSPFLPLSAAAYDGGFLPDIILLTLCYNHRGTCLNGIKKSFYPPTERFDNVSS